MVNPFKVARARGELVFRDLSTLYGVSDSSQFLCGGGKHLGVSEQCRVESGGVPPDTGSQEFDRFGAPNADEPHAASLDGGVHFPGQEMCESIEASIFLGVHLQGSSMDVFGDEPEMMEDGVD